MVDNRECVWLLSTTSDCSLLPCKIVLADIIAKITWRLKVFVYTMITLWYTDIHWYPNTLSYNLLVTGQTSHSMTIQSRDLCIKST